MLSPRLTQLLKLAAAWLAAALLMQALQGAMALGAGPRHTHRAMAKGQSSAPVGHLHMGFERHHHRADDASVQRSAGTDDSLDAANWALTLALALMAFGMSSQRLAAAGRLLRAALAWFCSDRTLQPLRRPPRAS